MLRHLAKTLVFSMGMGGTKLYSISATNPPVEGAKLNCYHPLTVVTLAASLDHSSYLCSHLKKTNTGKTGIPHTCTVPK